VNSFIFLTTMLRLCSIITLILLPHRDLSIFTRGWIHQNVQKNMRNFHHKLTPQSTFTRDGNEIEFERASSHLFETSLNATSHHDQPSSSSACSSIRIPVLYESKTVIVIDKPPHIAHHDTPTTMGILNHIRSLQNSTTTPPLFPYKGRIYGIHRLDRVTSGILLLAKTKEAAQSLGRLFKDRQVTKYYVALSNKKPKKKKQGWVKGDMVRSRRKSWKLNSTYKQPAVTRFFTAGLGETIGRGATDNNTDTTLKNPHPPKTLILFRPHTGKTHQLRVAGKSLGLPILGDAVYGDAEDALMTQRTYLHAAALHVDLDGEDITVWCPPDWSDHFHVNRNGSESENDPIEDIIVALMNKHCDSEPICNLVFKRD